eukprot:SAG31_NODE_1184_length_9496_cov_7.198680_7_plen_318_part_00
MLGTWVPVASWGARAALRQNLRPLPPWPLALGATATQMAALRDFINTEDDPDEYIKPLKEYLLTEGDISGDLAATEEHLKKLKFTYVELLTKQLFLGHVTSGSGDASVARSNEIDEMLAKTKRVAKRTAANCKERQQQASATTWPKLAEQWALLDRMRREYSADLEWLEHNEAGSSNKQILAHPSALVAAKTELVDTHYDLEQLEAEQRRLEEAVSNRTVENAQLAEVINLSAMSCFRCLLHVNDASDRPTSFPNCRPSASLERRSTCWNAELAGNPCRTAWRKRRCEPGGCFNIYICFACGIFVVRWRFPSKVPDA